jgi:hypothetical protein
VAGLDDISSQREAALEGREASSSFLKKSTKKLLPVQRRAGRNFRAS